jgi:hypothetical protein
VAVITHTKPFPGFAALLEPGWQEGQRRLAGLSSRSALLLAEKSNHMIQAEEPELIVDAVRSVRDQAMHGSERRRSQPAKDAVAAP